MPVVLLIGKLRQQKPHSIQTKKPHSQRRECGFLNCASEKSPQQRDVPLLEIILSIVALRTQVEPIHIGRQ